MFSKKVVLITGASSGIGAQTAIDFAELGATIIITGRNKINLENVAKSCEEISPQKVKPLLVVGDINKESDVEKIIKSTIERFDKLDVLVNNAGIFCLENIETTSLEHYDKVMTTNVRAPYYMTMLAVPYLIESKGSIVNVSSVAGFRSVVNVLPYSISKAALDQFTRCIALELGPKGVRVNSVNPGDIWTGIHLKAGMSQEDYDAYFKKSSQIYPIGRVGTTKEVSNAITFLASDAASNITGVILSVDGGLHVGIPH